jgi:O-antigen/teichoic acid export membrane protein
MGLVAFAVAPLVSQVLGPERRGRLVAIQLLPQLLADLASLGLGFSIVHFGARRPNSIGTLIRWSVRPAIIGSMLTFTIGQLLAGAVAGGSADDERLLRFYLALCPIVAFTTIAAESLRAAGNFKGWNTLILLQGVSWPIALLIGVIPGSPSLERVVAVHVGFSAVLLIVAWTIATRRAAPAHSDSDSTRRAYRRYGLHSMASTLPHSANAKSDQVLMSFRVDRDSLGLYSAAVGWSALTMPVMRGLTGVSMPHVSGAPADQLVARTRQLITLGLVAVGILSLGGWIGTLVLWGPMYGAEFKPALHAALVLIPAALLLEFNAVQGNILRSLGRPGLVAVLEGSVLVASTVALLVALTFSTVLGPAIVSLATYSAASLLYGEMIARQLNVPTHRLVGRDALRGFRWRRAATAKPSASPDPS